MFWWTSCQTTHGQCQQGTVVLSACSFCSFVTIGGRFSSPRQQIDFNLRACQANSILLFKLELNILQLCLHSYQEWGQAGNRQNEFPGGKKASMFVIVAILVLDTDKKVPRGFHIADTFTGHIDVRRKILAKHTNGTKQISTQMWFGMHGILTALLFRYLNCLVSYLWTGFGCLHRFSLLSCKQTKTENKIRMTCNSALSQLYAQGRIKNRMRFLFDRSTILFVQDSGFVNLFGSTGFVVFSGIWLSLKSFPKSVGKSELRHLSVIVKITISWHWRDFLVWQALVASSVSKKGLRPEDPFFNCWICHAEQIENLWVLWLKLPNSVFLRVMKISVFDREQQNTV